MKKLLAFLGVLWGGGAFGYWYLNDARNQHVSYKTLAVHKGDLQASINATGTIEPEEVVDVGTQVAGEIQRFGPDPRDSDRPISYGSPVDQGTVLAQLDDALFKSRVDQAKANVTKAEADVEQAESKLRQAERELERSRRLHDRAAGMVATKELDIAQADFESARAGLAVARSSVEVAKANLEEANVNLGYTTIRSPVKGVILDRRVNIGQTVVASLNAPSLFLIAKDLKRMEIWASVNETDIGAIHPGQLVKFTVGTFPDETFEGRVAQIRLNASMVQGVVTYTVVVSFDNPEGRLLPYLTARLRFEVETRKGVLLVPNAALRWQPRPENVAPDARAEAGRLAKLRGRGPGASATRGTSATATEGVLWARDGDYVRPVPVKVGLTDGIVSEVSGEGLHDGSEAVVGVVRREEADEVYSILPHAKSKK